MTLNDVRTLGGPAVRSTAGWIPSGRGPSGPIPGPRGTLWGPDGRLFAIVWPAATVGTGVGPVLRAAPVVKDQVVLSSAGCWSADGLSSTGFTGPLSEVPGSGTYARAAADGLTAVRLADIEALLRAIESRPPAGTPAS